MQERQMSVQEFLELVYNAKLKDEGKNAVIVKVLENGMAIAKVCGQFEVRDERGYKVTERTFVSQSEAEAYAGFFTVKS